MTLTALAQDPGAATLSEIARHWRVCEDTAGDIIAAARLPDVSLNARPRYRWRDVWRLEGEPWVHPVDWTAYRAPLLHPGDLPELDPHRRGGRQWRRLVASGRMPSIRLSPGVRRVRACVFERIAPHV
jgi:hypothetical protein